MKYFVDTLIWRDYYENRKDRFRPIGEWAFEFFKIAIRTNSLILYSDIIEKELGKDYNPKEIADILKIITKTELLKRIEIIPKQFKEAAILSKNRKVPFGDALNAILARDNNAILVSRDHHFEELKDIAIAQTREKSKDFSGHRKIKDFPCEPEELI